MDHRFPVDEPVAPNREIRLTGDQFHHAARVRRVRPGETVEVFDRDGHACRAVVIEVLDDAVVLRTDEEAPTRESSLQLTLGLALIKPEKFELVLQKGTELGVTRFVPVISERIQIRPERISKRRDRWERILEEAVKQCGRSTLPSLGSPTPFEELLNASHPCFVLDAGTPSSDLGQRAPSATILIGPEGGFSDEEIAKAVGSGCIGLRIGPRRLRAETAAIAAATILQARWGDLER